MPKSHRSAAAGAWTIPQSGLIAAHSHQISWPKSNLTPFVNRAFSQKRSGNQRRLRRERKPHEPDSLSIAGFERNHHELMVLCAPRALLVIGCSTDQESATHSDDWQSVGYINRAKEVYELLKVPERFEYAPLTGGHRATGPRLDPHWQTFFEKWLKEKPILSPGTLKPARGGHFKTDRGVND